MSGIVYKRLGENVSRTRRQRDLTQEDLAFMADLDRTYVARIERGRANPSVKVLNKIARVLNIRVHYLID